MKNLDLFAALGILNAHMNDDTQIVKIPRKEVETLKDIITKTMWDLRKQTIINNIKQEHPEYDYWCNFGLYTDDDLVDMYATGEIGEEE